MSSEDSFRSRHTVAIDYGGGSRRGRYGSASFERIFAAMKERASMAGAGDAERLMPDARRNVTGRPEE